MLVYLFKRMRTPSLLRMLLQPTLRQKSCSSTISIYDTARQLMRDLQPRTGFDLRISTVLQFYSKWSKIQLISKIKICWWSYIPYLDADGKFVYIFRLHLITWNQCMACIKAPINMKSGTLHYSYGMTIWSTWIYGPSYQQYNIINFPRWFHLTFWPCEVTLSEALSN